MPFFSIRIGSKYKQYRKQRFCCVKISRTVLNNTRAEVYCTTTTQPSREANNIRNFASRCNRMHFDVVRAKQSYIRGAHIKFRIQFLSFSQNQHFASQLFWKTSVVSREQSIVKKIRQCYNQTCVEQSISFLARKPHPDIQEKIRQSNSGLIFYFQ